MHTKMGIAAATLIGALAVTAGCGGAPPPTRSQADAEAAIRGAEELGTDSAPQAAYHLELARQQMQTAEQLIASGRMDAAARVLERAKADAELAIALSREASTRASAEATREHLRTLEDLLRTS